MTTKTLTPATYSRGALATLCTGLCEVHKSRTGQLHLDKNSLPPHIPVTSFLKLMLSAISAIVDPTPVVWLKLTGFRFSAAAIDVVCEWMRTQSHVRTLGLAENGLDDAAAVRIADALACHSCVIAHLDLGGNCIGPNGAQALAASLAVRSHCRGLLLDRNALGDVGVFALARAFTTHCWQSEPLVPLEILNLAMNRLTDDGCLAIGRMLRYDACRVQTLVLSGNPEITQLGCAALAGGIRSNSCLRDLLMDYSELKLVRLALEELGTELPEWENRFIRLAAVRRLQATARAPDSYLNPRCHHVNADVLTLIEPYLYSPQQVPTPAPSSRSSVWSACGPGAHFPTADELDQLLSDAASLSSMWARRRGSFSSSYSDDSHHSDDRGFSLDDSSSDTNDDEDDDDDDDDYDDDHEAFDDDSDTGSEDSDDPIRRMAHKRTPAVRRLSA